MKKNIVWLLDFWGDYYPIILAFSPFCTQCHFGLVENS